MSQPPATPYGPPHDSPNPPQQPGQPEQPGQPQQPGGWPPPQQQGFPPAQPGQPYGAPGQLTGPPPAKKSNVGKIVLIVLASLLVLCLGGAAIAWFTLKDDVGDAVEAANTRVVAPDTLAGRPKNTNPELLTAAEMMVTDLKSTAQNETSAVGGFYGDPAKQDLLMMVAASGIWADPDKELNDAETGFKTELSLTGMAPVEPGPLGGKARCGAGTTNGVPLGVCIWADRGSVGAVVMYFKSADQAKAEFTTIRGQIEQRS
ncbi:hypothetical protein AB0B57_17625 [Micromonospora sp. NPDC049101]|uniref:hypothetical protein n=1 Tax=Micromonospora sp. NPDC049101 TaxID=3155032 RepID=UPI0033D4DB7C